jgi:hypothetical protein
MLRQLGAEQPALSGLSCSKVFTVTFPFLADYTHVLVTQELAHFSASLFPHRIRRCACAGLSCRGEATQAAH